MPPTLSWINSCNPPPYRRKRFIATILFLAELQTKTPHQVSAQVVRVYEQVVAGLNLNLVLALQLESQEREQVPLTTENCLGALAVSVYDHFGTLTVTKWAKPTTCDQALALLKSDDDFGEEGTLEEGGQ
uniref:Uncharacterized protein n=1 Tax=Entomoneis paludosa TaxID=265537 RepID=A0A7S2YG56_9STRA|mmetsp:Transcript_31818/g.66412  ORF Transcript_31818/g.66412 Transcript_31818/m.66412 type:complete len:130 (+) Transcript_31818:223-612(+)